MDLEAWDDWFGCAPFRRQTAWLAGGNRSRAAAIRHARDPAVFAARAAAAVAWALGDGAAAAPMPLGDGAAAAPMRVVNATRGATPRLSAADAAWVRGRYAEDLALWEEVCGGGGGFGAVF